MKYLLVLACCIPAVCLSSPLPDKPHIYVEGSAEIDVEPDTITITVSLDAKHRKISEAKTDVDDRSRDLIHTCKILGIEPKDIATTTLRISPDYNYKNGRRVYSGTRVSRQVSIALNDLKKYPELIAALIDADISQTLSTTLSVADEEKLSDRALIRAIEDARLRAKRIADSQFMELGEIYSISEFETRSDERYRLYSARGVHGQLVPQMKLMASPSRVSEPFQPGLISARAKVYVVYLLE